MNNKKYNYDYKTLAIHKDTWTKLKKLSIVYECSIDEVINKLLKGENNE